MKLENTDLPSNKNFGYFILSEGVGDFRRPCQRRPVARWPAHFWAPPMPGFGDLGITLRWGLGI